MPQTFIKFFDLYGRKLGSYFINLAHCMLGLEYILLDCAGGLGHVLCFGNEPDEDIDIEFRTHATTPPSYDVSVKILDSLLPVYAN